MAEYSIQFCRHVGYNEIINLRGGIDVKKTTNHATAYKGGTGS